MNNYRDEIKLKESRKITEDIRKKILSEIKTSLNLVTSRSSGKYVLDKLESIRKYIWIYSFIISKNFPEFYYLETHSGPGICNIRNTEKIECGTPILALSNYPPFSKYRFIECDDVSIHSLNNLITKYFPTIDAKIMKGDCNKIITQVLSDFNQNLPTLCIVDPEGTEIHWETLQSLSEYKTDLIILFPYDMAIKRCISPNCPPNVQYAVTRMYGTEEWKRISDNYFGGKIRHSEARRQFVALYKDRLKTILNYPEVILSQIIKNDHNQPLYFLIVAGRKQIVRKIGKEVLDVRTEQTRLNFT